MWTVEQRFIALDSSISQVPLENIITHGMAKEIQQKYMDLNFAQNPQLL